MTNIELQIKLNKTTDQILNMIRDLNKMPLKCRIADALAALCAVVYVLTPDADLPRPSRMLAPAKYPLCGSTVTFNRDWY